MAETTGKKAYRIRKTMCYYRINGQIKWIHVSDLAISSLSSLSSIETLQTLDVDLIDSEMSTSTDFDDDFFDLGAYQTQKGRSQSFGGATQYSRPLLHQKFDFPDYFNQSLDTLDSGTSLFGSQEQCGRLGGSSANGSSLLHSPDGSSFPEMADSPGGMMADETSSAKTPKATTRRNAWGNMSYAELITTAIMASPEKRLTLAQVYEWMVQNVPYFRDKGDSNSSAGWKWILLELKSV